MQATRPLRRSRGIVEPVWFRLVSLNSTMNAFRISAWMLGVLAVSASLLGAVALADSLRLIAADEPEAGHETNVSASVADPSAAPVFSATPVVSSSGTILAGRFAAVPQDPFLAQEDELCPFGYINRPEPNPHQNFYFTRGAYNSGMFGRGGSWSTDFPKADRQFVFVMRRTLGWDVFNCENPINLADPALRSFPFLYMLEVGRMSLSPQEIENFRSYLLAGGFAYIDDFWDTNEWANFEGEIRKVLPEYDIVDIPLDHMIFRIIYPVDDVLQVPSINNGYGGNPEWYGECYQSACTPTVRGIFDDDGRLLVVMTHNSDLGDAWEWAEDPNYPFDRSNYAFSMAFNIIAYSMVY